MEKAILKAGSTRWFYSVLLLATLVPGLPFLVGAHPLHDTIYVGVNLVSPNVINFNLRVNSNKSQWLIYTDAFHPWWQASVDGQSVEISEADLAFKAIVVPPGTHQIEFRIRRWPRLIFQIQAALLGLAQLMFMIQILRKLSNRGAKSCAL